MDTAEFKDLADKPKGRKYSQRVNRPITEGQIEGLAVGRDKKVIPPHMVRKLAALGCKNAEICDFWGIDENTLTYNFRPELDIGRAELKQSLRRAMLENAISRHNAAVQIFLAKNLLGMSDNPIDTDATAPLPWDDTNI